MKKRKVVIVVFGMLLGLICSTSAVARCKDGDLGGTWYLHNLGTTDDFFGFWVRCKLVIKNSGRIRKSKSSCVDDVGQRYKVQRGEIDLRSNCRLSGVLSLFPAGEPSFAFDAIISHGNILEQPA